MAYIDFDPQTDPRLIKELQTLRQQITSPDPMTAAIQDRLNHVAQSGGGFNGRDFERVIGRNDLLPINYLARGSQAAGAVGRIDVPEEFGGTGSWGTGFLISPCLLLTNNHVLSSPEAAARAVIEFGYERDAKGFFKSSRRFRLDPGRAFITSPKTKLDYTIVAVEEISTDGAARREDYGFLRLNHALNKVMPGEFVSIIQHPNGGEKFISIRENKVLQIGGGTAEFKQEFLWYVSDTAPGSSGAPVFNDNWQVVAVHHKGVPVTRTIAEGEIELQRTSGEWIDQAAAVNLPEDSLKWEGNEGVRISAIVTDIRSQQQAVTTPFPAIQDLLDDIDGIRQIPGRVERVSIVTPDTAPADALTVPTALEAARRPARRVHPTEYYDGRQGYNPNFLSVAIPLPKIEAKALTFGKVAPVIGSDKGELKYEHFSIIFNAERRFAFLTAVNIDGSQSVSLGRNDEWWYDPRLPLDLQVDDALYGNEPTPPQNNYFDRGHLVRRLDPVWGDADTCATANLDTFHWTNCSPQYWEFNQKEILWQGLENFILTNIDRDNLRGSVFTGPLFSKDDEEHRQVKIPQAYWKVVAVVDSLGKLYTSAYVVSQKKYAKNIPFERLPVGKFNNFQVPIAQLTKITGISFGADVLAADVIAGTTDSRPLESVADIIHPRRPAGGDRSGWESLLAVAPVPAPSQQGRGRFGEHESFEAFLDFYTRTRAIKDKREDEAQIGLEARRKKIRQRTSRDVVEITTTVVDYLGLDSTGGDNHQQAFLKLTEIIKTDSDVDRDLRRVLADGEKIFLSIRYGDRMGLANPVPGVANGSTLKLRGEWIPKDRAYAHGGEKLSVIHFTHHPIGFVCNDDDCWS